MKTDSFLSKQRHTTPSRHAICIKLAGGDHKAGAFLYSVQHWTKYASAAIPGVEGHWIANTRVWWMRECCLTSSQYDRTISKLEKMGLIERCQYWFGPRNVLHLRPTTISLKYIASATTWKAADQFLPCSSIGNGGLLGYEKPSSPGLAICNEIHVYDEQGSPKTAISNTISNTSNNLEFNLENVAPASPPYVDGKTKDTNTKKTPGKIKKKADQNFEVNLQKVAADWKIVLINRYAEDVKAGSLVLELSPEELGGLASAESGFAQGAREGKADPSCEFTVNPEDYQVFFFSFLVSVVDQWPVIDLSQKPTYPSLSFLSKHWGSFIPGWLDPEC